MNEHEEKSQDRVWYLLTTKPRQEYIAVENLERQGYQIFLPLLQSRKRRGTEMRAVIEPMFPRYLFIYLNIFCFT